MPELFRYYCLQDDGKIAVGEHVEAPDLDTAITHAYDACRTHPTRAYRYVEVWRGAERLYASLHKQQERNYSQSSVSGGHDTSSSAMQQPPKARSEEHTSELQSPC